MFSAQDTTLWERRAYSVQVWPTVTGSNVVTVDYCHLHAECCTIIVVLLPNEHCVALCALLNRSKQPSISIIAVVSLGRIPAGSRLHIAWQP